MSRGSTAKISADNVNLGVFLCECGSRIAPKVELADLTKLLQKEKGLAHVEVLPFPCLAPGLDRIKEVAAGKGLNRLIVAGCENRITLSKFEKALDGVGLGEGRIDMVNLRDHVAQVHAAKPAALARKAAKLIQASGAWLKTLEPATRMRIDYQGPVIVLGGGIATFGAAQELAAQGVDTIIALERSEEEEFLQAHRLFPGEYHFYDRLKRLMQEVSGSRRVRTVQVGELRQVSGRFGDYTVTFATPDGLGTQDFQVGAIIAALDWEMDHQHAEFGHDGERIICQVEMHDRLEKGRPAPGKTVFWVNDFEAGHPFTAHLSLKSAWQMAEYLRESFPDSQALVLYNSNIPILLDAFDRSRARQLNISLIPYDGSVRPTIKSDFLSFNRASDQTEQEVPWDTLVLSARRIPGTKSLKTAKILGLEVKEEEFLERYPQMVRPDQVVLGEKLMVGSACQPCDLRNAIHQGRQVARKTAALVKKGLAGELYAPLVISTVDQAKCSVCTLCREICDCLAIQPVSGPVEGLGHNVPRMVDPMLCTGEGTCAASCPELALTLQNSTLAQHEARVTALAQRLAKNEAMGFGCQWSGAAAADQAGLRRLTYSERFYLLPVRCLGQIDPIVMGRAFLEGANGLLLIGCHPEECHHSYGIDHTWSRVWVMKKLLDLCGFERERIALAHADITKPDQYVRTVESFLETIDGLGPFQRNAHTRSKLKSLYDALHSYRVRWVLGVSLRRPWETTYPMHMPNPEAYDKTLTEILTEEFFRAQVKNLLREHGKSLQLADIAQALEVDEEQAYDYLKDMGYEGQVAIVYINRMPYYDLPLSPH
ncbi:MAG: hydrogenase iron-sulfur subunit [Deltaproteobacteria bacterium]|nr:hydrogenase iron-sulfur subunit [Deltaproteobacteria bacterium]